MPVLIALMHDLLITAGVYSLTRPGGDDVDGRGAADHLGLLALRHDHRVRPHPRERAAHAARRLLADRQPLDERGADAIPGDVVLHAACRSSRCCSSAARRSRTSPSRCSSASISGAYSSIFIASPVLTHWKERERGLRAPPRAHRRARAAARCRPTRSRRRAARSTSSPRSKRALAPAHHRARAARPGVSARRSSRRWCATLARARCAPGRRSAAEPEPPTPLRPRGPRLDEDSCPSDDKPQAPSGRATSGTGGLASHGHVRLGHDGPRHLALHDLPARPLLGRDRRRVPRRRSSARSSSG